MKRQVTKRIACFIGVVMIFIFMSYVPAASETTIDQPTLSEIISLKMADQEFLQFQKDDAKELKAFLVNPKNYAILSTANPRTALAILKDPNINEKRLAGSVMVPIDNPNQGGKSFKRIYKIYLILLSF